MIIYVSSVYPAVSKLYHLNCSDVGYASFRYYTDELFPSDQLGAHHVMTIHDADFVHLFMIDFEFLLDNNATW